MGLGFEFRFGFGLRVLGPGFRLWLLRIKWTIMEDAIVSIIGVCEARSRRMTAKV